MADNVEANAGSGGATFATDEIAGVHYPVSKLAHGAADSATLVSSASGLPVAQQGTWTVTVEDGGNTITVDGTVAVSGSVAVTNAGTFAVQVDGAALTALQLIDDPVATTGAAVPAKGMFVAGTDGTNARALKTDSSGELQVDVLTLPNVTIGAAIPAGTNNIGDVDVLSQPARAATTDTITAKLATDAIQNGTTALTPKFAAIDAATSGDNTIVAAVTAKKIRVLGCFMVAAGAVTARFESGAGGTALTGQMSLAANGGFVLPFNPVGWFETAAGTLLNLELSAATSVDGSLVYIEV